MSIQATEGVTSPFAGPAAATSATTGNMPDKDMFLQLLVAQMKYQDPMNPTDSSQFLSQSAQFTALEKMQAVADQTAALFSAATAFGASGLIGKQVTWQADGSTHTGTVDGVTFGASGPVLDVGGSDLPLASVQSVHQSTTTTAVQAQ